MGSLRLFLALCVALGHFGVPIGIPTSDVAVQSFFVISGFYMALVLNEKYGASSYYLFISNRILRLWPTYAAVMLLSFAAANNWRPALALDWPGLLYFFGSQIFIVGQEAYFFLFIKDGALDHTFHPAGMQGLLFTLAPVPQAWTLGFEFYFYLLAPLIVRRRAVILVAIIAASMMCRAVLLKSYGLGGEPWTYRFFPSELALFVTGSLAYRAHATSDEMQRRWMYLGLAAIAVVQCALLGWSQWGGISRVASLAILGLVIVGTPHLFKLSARIPWDRYLGELSYPLYICHFLVGWILLPETGLQIAFALLLSLVVAALVYRHFEQPINQWRQQRYDRRKVAIARLALRPAVA